MALGRDEKCRCGQTIWLPLDGKPVVCRACGQQNAILDLSSGEEKQAPMCGVPHPSLPITCRRPPKHDEEHEAGFDDGRSYASWPMEEKQAQGEGAGGAPQTQTSRGVWVKFDTKGPVWISHQYLDPEAVWCADDVALKAEAAALKLDLQRALEDKAAPSPEAPALSLIDAYRLVVADLVSRGEK